MYHYYTKCTPNPYYMSMICYHSTLFITYGCNQHTILEKIVIPFISKVTQQILRIVSVTPSLTDSYTYQNILPPSHSHPTTLGDVMYEQPLCQTDQSLQSPLHSYCHCLVCGCLDTPKPINDCSAGKESTV